MILENVVIETKTEYLKDEEEDKSWNRDKPVEFLVVSVNIPGGVATYKFKITKAQKDSLELAVKLQ